MAAIEFTATFFYSVKIEILSEITTQLMTRFPCEVMTQIIDYLRPRPVARNCLDTVASLRDMCLERKLSSAGTKITLIHRLLNDGCYARRPFWDTLEAGRLWWNLESACPQPLLTFHAELHDAKAWTYMSNAACQRAVQWQDEYYATGTIDFAEMKEFVHRAWGTVALAAKYHDRYLSAMKEASSPRNFTSPGHLAPKHYTGYHMFRVFDELIQCRIICRENE